MIKENLTLKLLDTTYVVCSLEKDGEIPSWAVKGDFLPTTKTENELSIVCKEKMYNKV